MIDYLGIKKNSYDYYEHNKSEVNAVSKNNLLY